MTTATKMFVQLYSNLKELGARSSVSAVRHPLGARAGIKCKL